MAEIDVWGVFVPTLLFQALAALLLQNATSRLLARFDLHRRLWHPTLFDAALFVLFLGGLTALTARM
ncbi:MAG: DUF1656 domain-containing protein [Phyllobacteriaceae bacterium]|nr:DUF1656 domain-containing protein [Phyllobacteriaceae bacterium]